MVYGFRYLSVSPSNYLDINSKITRLMYAYKNIKYMTFLFDNFIVSHLQSPLILLDMVQYDWRSTLQHLFSSSQYILLCVLIGR